MATYQIFNKIKTREKMEKAKKPCPFCKEEILEDAVKCRYCHEWFDGRRAQPPITMIQKPEYSNAQDTDRFLTLSIVSAFLYIYYWYFRSWRYLRDYRGLDISPIGRTIAGIIPIVGIYLDYSLFSKIHKFGDDLGCESKYSPGLLTFFAAILHIAGWSIIITTYVTSDPMVYLLSEIMGIFITCLGLAILYYVQSAINDIWAKKQPELKIREKLSGGEIAVIAVGIYMWFSWVIGIIAIAAFKAAY